MQRLLDWNRSQPIPPILPAREYEVAEAALRLSKIQPACHCEACDPNVIGKSSRMILCAICANKRCPHATDHRNPCGKSNEPGQKGSSWEDYCPPGGSRA
jgi:hypothetical protein